MFPRIPLIFDIMLLFSCIDWPSLEIKRVRLSEQRKNGKTPDEEKLFLNGRLYI
jgi:hypothetical protein